ncbi:MAG: hypothetical protein ACYTGC_10165 [Planctomycetota bacterium]|jgi:hypothetical protein
MTLFSQLRARRRGVLALIAAMGPAIGVVPAAGQNSVQLQNRRCLDCHGQPHIAELSPADRRAMVSLYADDTAAPELSDEPEIRPELFVEYDQVYRFSVHGREACVSCHPDCETLPHAPRAEPAQCSSCHEQESLEYDGSVHGQATHAGNGKAAHCHDCHGAHDILSSRNPQSRTYKLQLPFTCAKCHSNPRMMEEEGVHQPHAAEQYIDSMHGRGLLVDGLIVAPSCRTRAARATSVSRTRTTRAFTGSFWKPATRAVPSARRVTRRTRSSSPASARSSCCPTSGAASATPTGSSATVRRFTARRWPWAGPGWPRATTATDTTTSCR